MQLAYEVVAIQAYFRMCVCVRFCVSFKIEKSVIAILKL